MQRHPEFNKVVASYPTLETEQARAIAEARLWGMATPEERSAYGNRPTKWLLSLGLPTRDCRLRLRATIFNADAPQFFWERVDQNGRMPLRTAVRLLGDAKKLAQAEGLQLSEAAQRILAEYDQQGYEVKTPTGTIRKPSRADRIRTASIRAGKPGGWNRLRECIQHIVDGRAHGIEPIERDSIFRKLDAEIRAAIANFDARVGALRRCAPISRSDVLRACDVLKISPPAPGAPVDLRQAKRQKCRLVRIIHSDSGGDGNGEDMRIVTEAYITLENYNKKGSK